MLIKKNVVGFSHSVAVSFINFDCTFVFFFLTNALTRQKTFLSKLKHILSLVHFTWMFSLSEDAVEESQDEKDLMFELYKTDIPLNSSREHTLNIGAFLEVSPVPYVPFLP